MAESVVLHQFEISPFCDKVRRILQVKDIPYQIREVPVSRSPFDTPRVNRIGKLPCLEHAGRRIADSSHIASYLEEHFPEPPLRPADPAARALCHVLEDWADESLYFYEMTLRFTYPRNAARFVPQLVAHDPPWFQTLARYAVPFLLGRVTRAQGIGRKPREMVRQELALHLDALVGLLGEREWLVGDALTLADISVFSQMACIRAADEGGALVAERPAVASWLDRVDQATGDRSRQ